MSANDRQVGGDHYKTLGQFQPWDVLQYWLTPEEYRGWMKGNAIVYLARERQKGGDADIKKAEHHLQKLNEVLDAASPEPSSKRCVRREDLPPCTCSTICLRVGAEIKADGWHGFRCRVNDDTGSSSGG